MGGMGRLRFALGLLPMACWHGDLGMPETAQKGTQQAAGGALLLLGVLLYQLNGLRAGVVGAAVGAAQEGGEKPRGQAVRLEGWWWPRPPWGCRRGTK